MRKRVTRLIFCLASISCTLYGNDLDIMAWYNILTSLSLSFTGQICVSLTMHMEDNEIIICLWHMHNLQVMYTLFQFVSRKWMPVLFCSLFCNYHILKAISRVAEYMNSNFVAVVSQFSQQPYQHEIIKFLLHLGWRSFHCEPTCRGEAPWLCDVSGGCWTWDQQVTD